MRTEPGASPPLPPAFLPLLVGVAGHVNLRPEDRGAQDQELRRFLSGLWAPGGELPAPHALSSLACGADRLFAEVALSLGWRLIVVLPMAQAAFEATFEDGRVEPFRTLLARADQVIEVPTSEETVPYVNAAQFIARRAHLMVVFWDGVSTGREDGGTSYTVALRQGAATLGATLRSDGECFGPTYWIHAPRQPGVRRQAPGWLPLEGGDPGEVTGRLLQRQRDFNRLAEEQARLAQGALQTEWRRVGSPPEETLGRLFAHASVAATASQRHKMTGLVWALYIILLGALVKGVTGLLGASWEWLGFLTVSVTLLVASALILRVNRARHHDRHIDYRALSEALRVGIALRQSGHAEPPTTLVPMHLWGQETWLPDTVGALWTTLGPARAQSAYARESWIAGQLAYMNAKLEAVEARQRKISLLTAVPFSLAALLSGLALLVDLAWGPTVTVGALRASLAVLLGLSLIGTMLAAHRPWWGERPRRAHLRWLLQGLATAALLGLLATGLTPPQLPRAQVTAVLSLLATLCALTVGAVSFYANKQSFDEDRARYAALKNLYRRADQLMRGAEHDPARQARIVRELAAEAMTEFVIWANTVRQRQPEVLKG